MKVGRNEPCPCGSGLKYKNCHLLAAGEVPPTERLWQRFHETSGRLIADLATFVKSTYGLALYDEAWREFTLFEEEVFDQDSIHVPVFIPWFYYQWRPEPLETHVPQDEMGSFPVASAYLKRRGRYEDPLATRCLQACLGAAFSFLDVLTVSPGTGLTVRDSITGLETTVIEKTASQTLQKGDIVFARVVNLGDLSILDGCSPMALPPLEKAPIIELRKRIRKAYATVTPEVLKEYDLEMLDIYHAAANRLLNPRQPVFHKHGWRSTDVLPRHLRDPLRTRGL